MADMRAKEILELHGRMKTQRQEWEKVWQQIEDKWASLLPPPPLKGNGCYPLLGQSR